MTENKCGYQLHLSVTSFLSQHDPDKGSPCGAPQAPDHQIHAVNANRIMWVYSGF